MFCVVGLEEEGKWLDWLDGFENKDIYYYPNYCRLNLENGEGIPFAAYYEDAHGQVLYVYLERNIADLSWLKARDQWTKYRDIVTPYGYVGPLVSCKEGNRKQLLAGFRNQFDKFCQEQKIVSEFIRFHPLLKNHLDLPSSLEVEFNRFTVTVDLSQGENKIWENMHSAFRNRTRKALKKGVTVTFSKTEEDLREFQRLYYLTMDKVNADKYYYFPTSYFKNLLDFGVDFVLANAWYGGKIIASGLILCCRPFMHRHLAGSDSDYLHFAANNLVDFETIKYGAEKGYKYLHIGGGNSSNDKDSLFRYKKNMAPDGLKEFWVGKKIHIDEVYKHLSSQWQESVPGSKVDMDFFPIYRWS